MSKFKACEDCGRDIDTEAPHGHACPGSDDERIAALEAEIEDLRAELDGTRRALANEITALRSAVGLRLDRLEVLERARPAAARPG